MNLLTQTSRQLSCVYPDGEAHAMARIVLEDAFGLTQTDVILGKDKDLSQQDLDKLHFIVTRLLKHEPLQYILGHTMFHGHSFRVAPGCLIPRPETEDLVDLVLHDSTDRTQTLRLLDIGTGSGCIAISLALALGNRSKVWALDVSREALTIARSNAQQLGADITFIEADILSAPCFNTQWDVIVSNPPYVRELEAADMERNVLEHEPHLALFVPNDDALRFYRAIAHFAQEHLAPGGSLYFEINKYLSSETAAMLENEGFIDVKCFEDRFSAPRMISCRRP